MTETTTGIPTVADIQQAADGVALVCYTDPLCCWSYAMQPQIEELQSLLGEKLTIRYCMGGLIPDWNSYHDTVNSISRPLQMGPLWMEVRHRSGLPLQDRLWISDPPASSYPACIAVKAAGLQGSHFEPLMLHALRQLAMVQGKNVARNAVLSEAATLMPESFDQARFHTELMSGAGTGAFRKDLEEVRKLGLERFPAVKISTGGKAAMITGFRTAAVLLEGISRILT